MTDLGALVLAVGLVVAARSLRLPKTLVADAGAALSLALTAAVATWVEEMKAPASAKASTAVPVTDTEQLDVMIQRGAEAGVEELRALYAEKGVVKNDTELHAEAMELLRADLTFPTDEGY